MPEIVQVDHSKLDLRLGKLEPAVHDALLVAVTLDAGELQGRVESLVSGELVQIRTGKFVKSIKVSVRQSANRVTGRVYSKDPVAHILEGGARIPPHRIDPSAAHALLLQVRSGQVFAAHVQSPGAKIGPRWIFRQAFDEMKPTIESDLRQAAINAIPAGE